MIGKDSVSSCLLGWERERGREHMRERKRDQDQQENIILNGRQ